MYKHELWLNIGNLPSYIVNKYNSFKGIGGDQLKWKYLPQPTSCLSIVMIDVVMRGDFEKLI